MSDLTELTTNFDVAEVARRLGIEVVATNTSDWADEVVATNTSDGSDEVRKSYFMACPKGCRGGEPCHITGSSWRCFSCWAVGDSISLVQSVKGVGIGEAATWLSAASSWRRPPARPGE